MREIKVENTKFYNEIFVLMYSCFWYKLFEAFTTFVNQN